VTDSLSSWSRGGRLLELAVVAVVVIVDQLTKMIVVARLDLHESVTIVPGLLDLTYVRNTGAAFGLLNAADFPGKPVVIAVIALVALFGVGVYAAQLPSSHRVTRAGLALVLGGAAGNLIDRLRQGFVVDFVDAYWNGWHFWAFNVADAAITVGVAIIVLDLLRPAEMPLPGAPDEGRAAS
jgi:signal peptidase II